MSININFKKILLTVVFMLFGAQNALASQSTIPKDPYQPMRYSQAFDQEAIYRQFRPLMEKLGCAKNVFPNVIVNNAPQPQEAAPEVALIEAPQIISEHFGAAAAQQPAPEGNDFGYQPLVNEPEIIPEQEPDYELVEIEGVTAAQEFDRFEQACLKRLNKARILALAQPALNALSQMAIVGGGAGLAVTTLGASSMGGSIATMSAFFNALENLKDSYQSGQNLYKWPDNPLGEREEYFAKNKCFIPRVLWPKITNAFVSARQSEFGREKHTDFIDFALAFTAFKPKPKIGFKNNMSVEAIKNELNRRIDDFFANYQQRENIQGLSHIKINVSKFIDQIVNNQEARGPRYIYLYGSGGIGKTYFVQKLSEWIDELIPNSVKFEDLIITSEIQLEGSPELPGAFLKVLRNQFQANKRGSVVMIDEATWLNEPGMVSSAKRAFNGNSSKLSTSYFGTNIDGTGIELDLPLMLIFVASNDKINDPALTSRFDIVNFPAPTLDTLINMAFEIATKSQDLRRIGCAVSKEMIKNWVESLKPEEKNFRFVDGNVEPYLLENCHKLNQAAEQEAKRDQE
jgi:hypothetical protein